MVYFNSLLAQDEEIRELMLGYRFNIYEVAIRSANGIGDYIASEDNKLELVYVPSKEYSGI